MQTSLSRLCRRATIIGLAVVALAGCSAMRVGYNQAPQLTQWWLDGYLDFDDAQTPRVRASLEQWFAWHRETQLVDYAELLGRAQQQVAGPLSAAQACQWNDELRARIEPAVERALPLVAEFVPTLQPAQLAHLARRYAKKNAELRKEFVQPRADERLKGAIERMVERLESIYGPLDETQQRVVVAGVSASPFDAERWLADREARQRDVLQTIEPLVVERADRERVLRGLRPLARRLVGGTATEASTYQQRLAQHNCAFFARVHNLTTPRQREHARDKLRGWEGDVRQLAAETSRPKAALAAAPGQLLPASPR
ncbi:MAG TPA: DUF6279 family lipoprotein [Rubrivivax sp.]